jgi:hypothetical protein
MEQNSVRISKKTGKPVGKAGGKQPGAGRPPNSKQQITVVGLLDALKERSGGKEYTTMLVDDFLKARTENDKHTILKYHNMILNKVMNTLNKIEVNEGQDAVEAKKQAFAEALAKLTGIQETK